MMYLDDPTLGRLDIGPLDDGGCNIDGYVTTDMQFGFPAVREVTRERAWANGVVDDTRYLGSSAITVSVVIDQTRGDAQLLIDRLKPYLSPLYRPRLVWSIPGSVEMRSAVVRGVDAPVAITSDKYNTIVCSWVVPAGTVESPDQTCIIITPTQDEEEGRTYDLEFDRSYPPSLGIGDRLIVNRGNATADWTATIFGAATEPSLTVNGVPIRFDREGGLALTGGTSVVIDTRERTILLNGDDAESRYDKVNFLDWSWDQVRLRPGDNIVRFGGDTLSEQASTLFCYRSVWLP